MTAKKVAKITKKTAKTAKKTIKKTAKTAKKATKKAATKKAKPAAGGLGKPPKSLGKRSFLRRYNIREKDFRDSGLDWNTLTWIYSLHAEKMEGLYPIAAFMVEQLQPVRAVHSLKFRIKDPEHVVEKIIRKQLREATPGNYAEHITDLVGIRALHLYKDDWLQIHEFVSKTWDLQAPPVAKLRKGDRDHVRDLFRKHGCKVEDHPAGYRSVHYRLESRPFKEVVTVELQVRTLFEEAWSEIDHEVRYPSQACDPVLAEFLMIFNRVAGSADEMGSFVGALRDYEARTKGEVKRARQELRDKQDELNKMIEKLGISKVQRRDLQKQIQDVSRSSLPAWTNIGPTSGIVLSGGSSVQGVPWSSAEPSILSSGAYRSLWSTGETRPCTSCGEQYIADPLINETQCPECRGKRGQHSIFPLN